MLDVKPQPRNTNIRRCKTLENLSKCSTKKVAERQKRILPKCEKKGQHNGDVSKQQARRQGSYCLEAGSRGVTTSVVLE